MVGEMAVARATESAKILERFFGPSRDAHRVKRANKFRQKARDFDEEITKLERKVEQTVRTAGMHGHIEREYKRLLKATTQFERISSDHTENVVDLMRRLFVQLEESREGMLHVRVAMHRLTQLPDVKVKIPIKGGKAGEEKETSISMERLRTVGREHEERVQRLLRILEAKADYFKNISFNLRALSEHAQSERAV